MALDKVFLLLAYGMLLCGLVARLCIPRVEAALFDAFNELDLTQFWSNLRLSAGGCAKPGNWGGNARVCLAGMGPRSDQQARPSG